MITDGYMTRKLASKMLVKKWGFSEFRVSVIRSTVITGLRYKGKNR